MGADQVTTVGGAVGLPENDVSVDLGLAPVERDVADEGEHFDLLVDVDLRVSLSRPIEVTEHRVAQGTDGGEVGSG